MLTETLPPDQIPEVGESGAKKLCNCESGAKWLCRLRVVLCFSFDRTPLFLTPSNPLFLLVFLPIDDN